MNIQNIQKHYDKLTTRERFALLTAAIYRGDEADRAALVSSSPRKTWSIPTTHGLADAFDFMAKWHTMYLLSCETSFYFLLSIGDMDMERVSFKINGEKFSLIDAMKKAQRDILRECEAWRAVCTEYSVDPDKLTEDLPGGNMLFMLEAMIKEYAADMGVVIAADEVETVKADLRAVIEAKRKEWE